MAKINVKALLVEKGERYAVYAAGGIMLLLMIVGIIKLGDAPNPQDLIKDIDGSAAKITSAVNNPKGDVPLLPDYATKHQVFVAVRGGTANSLFFDPINPPDNRRINPSVLPIFDIQADFIGAKILAYDIRITEDGEMRIGVMKLTSTKGEPTDKSKHAEFINQLQSKGGTRKKAPAGFNGNPGTGFMGHPMGQMGYLGNPAAGIMGNPMGQMGYPANPMGQMGYPANPMAGIMGNPASGFMGNPMGQMGFAGRPPGPGIMGNPMGQMGYMGGSPGNYPGGPGGNAAIESGDRYGIEYVTLDPEKLEGKRLALTIYPQRMVVIQAAFPYKAQVEEIRRALRLSATAEVFDPANDAVPLFRGFVIERQVLQPNGKVDIDWQPLNVEEKYRETIFRRTVSEQPERPEMQFVKLPEENQLVMPLPWLVSGGYAGLRLAPLLETIRKLQILNKPLELPKSTSKLKGEGDIFRTTPSSTVGTQNQPNSGADPMYNIPKYKMPGKEFDSPMGKTSQDNQVGELPDAVLVRIIDNDIVPDRHYKYRIKLLMQNPNWVGEKNEKGVPASKFKYDLVSKPSDADKDIIDGPFVEMKGDVSVPREDYLFAIDPVLADPKDASKKTGHKLEIGQALLEYQRWLPIATVGSYKEPVADWIVADVVVKRGTYVGGKQYVNLPIWSSEYNRYILRLTDPEKGSKSKEPRRGAIMDPTKPGPQYAVVDIEGGKLEAKTNSRTISDEAASEILLLDEDGKLQVRSSFADRNDPERTKREEVWKQWIEKTEKDTTAVDNKPTGVGQKQFE